MTIKKPSVCGGGKLLNGTAGGFHTRMQVQLATAGPGMTRQHIGRMETHPLIEACPGIAEQCFEYPAHGKHGGAGIDTDTTDRELPHFATGFVGTFNHGDIETGPCEIHGCGEAADTSADNDNPLAAHATADARPAKRRATARRW